MNRFLGAASAQHESIMHAICFSFAIRLKVSPLLSYAVCAKPKHSSSKARNFNPSSSMRHFGAKLASLAAKVGHHPNHFYLHFFSLLQSNQLLAAELTYRAPGNFLTDMSMFLAVFPTKLFRNSQWNVSPMASSGSSKDFEIASFDTLGSF